VGSSTRSKKFSRGFFDSEVREAIDTRRRAHSTFVATEPGSTEAREFWSRFVEARDNARQLVSEKKKHEFQRFVDQVTDSADASNMKLCWLLLEHLKSRKAPPLCSRRMARSRSLCLSASRPGPTTRGDSRHRI
jgi:hypothetical protein